MTRREVLVAILAVLVEQVDVALERVLEEIRRENEPASLPTRADLLAMDPRNRAAELDRCNCPECADEEMFVHHLSASEALALLNDPEGRELLGLEEPDATEYTATDWYIEMVMAVDPLTDKLAQNPIKLARPKTA